MNDYRSRDQGCVTRMLTDLKLDSLQDRHTYNKLVMLYKIAGSMVPAVDPDVYLTRKTEGRLIKPKRYSDFETKNIIRVANNTRAFKIQTAHTDQLKNSFFVKTLEDWNHLADSIVHAATVEGFKAALQKFD